MGEENVASPTGIPQLLISNTLVLNGALFLGILALHTVLEDSTINNNYVSIVLLAMALALLIKSADFFIEGAKGLATCRSARGGHRLDHRLHRDLTPGDFGHVHRCFDVATNPRNRRPCYRRHLRFHPRPNHADFGRCCLRFEGSRSASWLKRDGMIMFSSIGLLTVFLFTGEGLSRVEGAILMSLYVAYIYWALKTR